MEMMSSLEGKEGDKKMIMTITMSQLSHAKTKKRD